MYIILYFVFINAKQKRFNYNKRKSKRQNCRPQILEGFILFVIKKTKEGAVNSGNSQLPRSGRGSPD